MPELGRQQMRELTARLRPFPGLVLADKLGTRPDHEVCIAAGCDLFQGYFFCRPAVVGTRGIAANRLALLQVVAALNDPAIELSDIEQLVARDVALSFRLLRYVNSAFFGLRGDVRSIGQALALLGTGERATLGHAEHAGQHRQQADRADPHRADPRSLLRAGRRPGRSSPAPPSCSPSACSR